MAQRYATLAKTEDGEEIVSSIAVMEGNTPEIRADQVKNFRVVRVDDGVKIGMVKGGKIDAVGGYGWPEGSPNRATPISEKEAGTSNPDEKVRASIPGGKK